MGGCYWILDIKDRSKLSVKSVKVRSSCFVRSQKERPYPKAFDRVKY